MEEQTSPTTPYGYKSIDNDLYRDIMINASDHYGWDKSVVTDDYISRAYDKTGGDVEKYLRIIFENGGDDPNEVTREYVSELLDRHGVVDKLNTPKTSEYINWDEINKGGIRFDLINDPGSDSDMTFVPKTGISDEQRSSLIKTIDTVDDIYRENGTLTPSQKMVIAERRMNIARDEAIRKFGQTPAAQNEYNRRVEEISGNLGLEYKDGQISVKKSDRDAYDAYFISEELSNKLERKQDNKNDGSDSFYERARELNSDFNKIHKEEQNNPREEQKASGILSALASASDWRRGGMRQIYQEQSKVGKEYAAKMFNDATIDLYEKWEDAKKSSGVGNLAAGTGEGFVDFWESTLGMFTNNAKNAEVVNLTNKIDSLYNAQPDTISDLEKQKNVYNELSRTEKNLLESFSNYYGALETIGKTMPKTRIIGESVGQSLGFMTEFVLSGGTGWLKGAAKSGGKAVLSGLSKAAQKRGINHAAKLAEQGIGRLGRGESVRLFLQPGKMAPSIYKATNKILNAGDKFLKNQIFAIPEATIQTVLQPSFYRDLGDKISLGASPNFAFADVLYDHAVENWSERVFVGSGKAAKLTGSAINFDKIKGAKGLIDLVKNTGEEFTEELIGDFVKRIPDWKDQGFSKAYANYWDDKADTFYSVALMTGMLGGAGMTINSKLANKLKYDGMAKIARKALPEFLANEIDNLSDNTDLTSIDAQNAIGSLIESSSNANNIPILKLESNVQRYLAAKMRQDGFKLASETGEKNTKNTQEDGIKDIPLADSIESTQNEIPEIEEVSEENVRGRGESVDRRTGRGIVEKYGSRSGDTQREAIEYDGDRHKNTRRDQEAESTRIIGLAQEFGDFIPKNQLSKFGGVSSEKSGESKVYLNEDSNTVYKVKDPFAKAPLKNMRAEDAIYEPFIHNLLFPEAPYDFVGITEDSGDVRIVLSQPYVKSRKTVTDKQIKKYLENELGLKKDGKYSYGNEYFSIDDVGEKSDNVLLGDDGKLYFIDPIIKLKKPAKEVYDYLSERAGGIADNSENNIDLVENIKDNEISEPISQGEYRTEDEEDGGMGKVISELKRRSEENARDAQKVGRTVSGREQEEIKYNPNNSESLLLKLNEKAQKAPVLALNPENWTKEFGEDGMIDTPIGSVKMGENQYLKILKNNRENQFGMIKPTLENPDIILQEYSISEKKDGRNSTYLFIKSFDINGEKYRNFASVTVNQEGQEVVISNHFLKESQVKNKLKNGKLLYISTRLDTPGQISLEQTSHADSGASSESKDKNIFGEEQELEQRLDSIIKGWKEEGEKKIRDNQRKNADLELEEVRWNKSRSGIIVDVDGKRIRVSKTKKGSYNTKNQKAIDEFEKQIDQQMEKEKLRIESEMEKRIEGDNTALDDQLDTIRTELEAGDISKKYLNAKSESSPSVSLSHASEIKKKIKDAYNKGRGEIADKIKAVKTALSAYRYTGRLTDKQYKNILNSLSKKNADIDKVLDNIDTMIVDNAFITRNYAAKRKQLNQAEKIVSRVKKMTLPEWIDNDVIKEFTGLDIAGMNAGMLERYENMMNDLSQTRPKFSVFIPEFIQEYHEQNFEEDTEEKNALPSIDDLNTQIMSINGRINNVTDINEFRKAVRSLNRSRNAAMRWYENEIQALDETSNDYQNKVDSLQKELEGMFQKIDLAENGLHDVEKKLKDKVIAQIKGGMLDEAMEVTSVTNEAINDILKDIKRFGVNLNGFNELSMKDLIHLETGLFNASIGIPTRDIYTVWSKLRSNEMAKRLDGFRNVVEKSVNNKRVRKLLDNADKLKNELQLTDASMWDVIFNVGSGKVFYENFVVPQIESAVVKMDKQRAFVMKDFADKSSDLSGYFIVNKGNRQTYLDLIGAMMTQIDYENNSKTSFDDLPDDRKDYFGYVINNQAANIPNAKNLKKRTMLAHKIMQFDNDGRLNINKTLLQIKNKELRDKVRALMDSARSTLDGQMREYSVANATRRGIRLNMMDNYFPRLVWSNSKTEKNAESMFEKTIEVGNLTPTTIPSALKNRTGEINPVEIDVSKVISTSVRESMTDYFMSPAFAQAHSSILKMEEQGGKSKVAFEQIDNAIKDRLKRNYKNEMSKESSEFIDKLDKGVNKFARTLLLGNAPKLVKEFVSNQLGGITSDGVIGWAPPQKMAVLNQIADDMNLTSAKNIMKYNEIIREASGKKKGIGEKSIEKMIALNDALTSSAIYYKTFNNKFKEISGENFDYDKIQTDPEYISWATEDHNGERSFFERAHISALTRAQESFSTVNRALDATHTRIIPGMESTQINKDNFFAKHLGFMMSFATNETFEWSRGWREMLYGIKNGDSKIFRDGLSRSMSRFVRGAAYLAISAQLTEIIRSSGGDDDDVEFVMHDPKNLAATCMQMALGRYGNSGKLALNAALWTLAMTDKSTNGNTRLTKQVSDFINAYTGMYASPMSGDIKSFLPAYAFCANLIADNTEILLNAGNKVINGKELTSDEKDIWGLFSMLGAISTAVYPNAISGSIYNISRNVGSSYKYKTKKDKRESAKRESFKRDAVKRESSLKR